MESTRLAAIMFTDIAGYSSMMEEDEPRTIAVIEEHNRIVFPIITEASGEVIDAIGDGLLVMFPSVREAVNCALRIQRTISRYNKTARENMRFLLRIGIHLGEIWEHEGKVYGNGVNVAARVQPYAVPGGICVSEDVERQVGNKLDETFTSLGVKPLRNISRQIELYSVATGVEGGNRSPEALKRGAGEFDEIKEQLLHEREKIAQKRAAKERSKKPDDIGTAIENRVFSFVERVMDTAIEKWDNMPDEKKRRAAEEARSHRSNSDEATHAEGETKREPHPKPHFDVKTAGTHHHQAKRAKSESSGELAAGIVFGVGFGLGYFVFGIGWMIVPMIVLGGIPLAAGTTKMMKSYLRSRAERRRRPQELEGRILEAATELGGKVTVVQIASRVAVSLDEASLALDRMTSKGYLLQHVLETGVIQYEFPALSDTPEEPEAEQP